MITKIFISKRAKKDLENIPEHVIDKLIFWVRSVERQGVEVVKKIPGFHDEPLKGKRIGMRSIRLSRSYRAIYRVIQCGGKPFLQVEEINKHDY